MAVFAVSAVASASASATCFKVAVAHTGNYEDSSCTVRDTVEEYIKVSKLETRLKAGEWCAKVEEPETGNYGDAACTKAKAAGAYIKVGLVKEFEHCVKQTTKTFEYTEKECKTKSSNKTGEFEKESVPAGSTIKFTGKEGVSHFYTANFKGILIVLTCTGDTSKGEITGAKTIARVTVTFTGCTAKEGEKTGCSIKTAGQPAGTMKLNSLRGTLGTVAKAEAVSEVGESLEPEGTGGFWTAEAECLSEFKTFQVAGSVIGEVKPINVMQTTGELIFEVEPPKSPKQKIKFIEGVKDIMMLFGGAMGFESKDVITFAEPIEVT
jgi:hypothetical protein